MFLALLPSPSRLASPPDLIRQIRALERVPAFRAQAAFDPTATAGHGLLAEMSVAELRERLAALRDEQARQEEAKRAEIAEQKRQVRPRNTLRP